MTALAAKQFTASEVFAGTGIRPEKQYQWDDRGVTVPSRNDKLPSGSGDPHLKSIETVYQLAITAALVRLGVGPKAAAGAARKFTNQSQPGRSAGELFKQDLTVLCIRPTGRTRASTGSHQPSSQPAPLRGRTRTDSTYKRGQTGEQVIADHGTAFVAIDISKICQEVDTALSHQK
jgi:hypothetical protein